MTLSLNLKKEWYDKIACGEKTIEYREYKKHWIIRIEGKNITDVVLKNGYNTHDALTAQVEKIEIINGLQTDLKIDKQVYAIHLTNIIGHILLEDAK